MDCINKFSYNISHCSLSNNQMIAWRKLNKIPSYVNASYTGYTGMKAWPFTSIKTNDLIKFDVTKNLHRFEESILQNLKDIRKKPFGYLRALWKIGQNMGTGESWDTKFLPEFPGRDKAGNKQYAIYKNEIVSGNDISNIFYGHICAYMGLPTKIAQIIAKMDACGLFELITKGRFPDKTLLSFRDTFSDQLAIKRGVEEFCIADYRLR